jgi:hypothetical protein
MVGKINNRKIKVQTVKEIFFEIYFVLKKDWKINIRKDRANL